MNINKYLKSIGLSGDTKHKQLDNRLFLSLDDSGQDKLHAAWETMRLFGRSSDLYSVPQNLKQASLLFSHDYERIKKSIEWIENTISYLNSQSIIDMGCGYGVLIKYLQTKYPDINLMGIDKKPNLIQIGRTLTGINLI